MSANTYLVLPGDVWRDLDPRGGPTFKVLRTDGPFGRYATVVGLDGKRERRVLLDRFRNARWGETDMRSGYALVSREVSS